MVNLDVNCTNHLLFHRGKQWELGQVLLQFMCMSMTPHRSMCMWRAKEWVLPGLLRLKGFFIQKIHDVICFCVCSYSSLVNEHLLKIFEFGYLVTHVIQCSCYAWTGLTDVTDMLLHSLCVLKGETKVNRGSLRPTAKVKTRVPWIPPGKASTRDASYKWEVKWHLNSILILKDCFCVSMGKSLSQVKKFWKVSF